jgi:hypothetical protein
MTWGAWRCWFRSHEYVYEEVGLDPKQPEASAKMLELLADEFDGNRLGLNRCRHCGRTDGRGVVFPDGSGGTITGDEYVERRYRQGVEQVVRMAEEQHGGEVRIDVPSLSDEPIPLRDALKIVTELDIAASREERERDTRPAMQPTPPVSRPAVVQCWSCKAPLPVTEENRGTNVKCSGCGVKQRLPA